MKPLGFLPGRASTLHISLFSALSHVTRPPMPAVTWYDRQRAVRASNGLLCSAFLPYPIARCRDEVLQLRQPRSWSESRITRYSHRVHLHRRWAPLETLTSRAANTTMHSTRRSCPLMNQYPHASSVHPSSVLCQPRRRSRTGNRLQRHTSTLSLAALVIGALRHGRLLLLVNYFLPVNRLLRRLRHCVSIFSVCGIPTTANAPAAGRGHSMRRTCASTGAWSVCEVGG
ncbi:hypothetical protein K438DRAFT_180953 [Mycena galopus ATCC 62051]|nr:hypothetical protein K438DRAFT_180953 [Mycena galopus ATCC 62051]